MTNISSDIITPCGDACNHCPRYIATKSGNVKELWKVAVLWKELGYRDRVVSVEEISCNGCTAKSPCAHGIAKCAAAKKVRTCGSCAEYACRKVLKAFQRTESSARQLKGTIAKDVYDRLHKAFFRKKEILDAIHKRKQ